MRTPTAEASPVLVARITGILFVVMTVGAGFAELGVRRVLVVPGDASSTAAKILGSERLFLLGFFGYLIAFLSDVAVAVLLYILLRSASRALSLVAASFRVVYAAIAGASLMSYLGALFILRGDRYTGVLETARLRALSLFSLNMFEHGFRLALVFFGIHLLLLGGPLFMSGYFPRIIGALVSLAGFAYLIDEVSYFLFPAFEASAAPLLMPLETLEIVLAIWLLVKGVRTSPQRLSPSSAEAA